MAAESAGDEGLAMRRTESISEQQRADLLYTMFVFDRVYAPKKLVLFVSRTPRRSCRRADISSSLTQISKITI